MPEKRMRERLLDAIKDEMSKQDISPYRLSIESGVKLGSIIKLLGIQSSKGKEPFQVHATTLLDVLEHLDLLEIE